MELLHWSRHLTLRRTQPGALRGQVGGDWREAAQSQRVAGWGWWDEWVACCAWLGRRAGVYLGGGERGRRGSMGEGHTTMWCAH